MPQLTLDLDDSLYAWLEHQGVPAERALHWLRYMALGPRITSSKEEFTAGKPARLRLWHVVENQEQGPRRVIELKTAHFEINHNLQSIPMLGGRVFMVPMGPDSVRAEVLDMVVRELDPETNKLLDTLEEAEARTANVRAWERRLESQKKDLDKLQAEVEAKAKALGILSDEDYEDYINDNWED